MFLLKSTPDYTFLQRSIQVLACFFIFTILIKGKTIIALDPL